MNATATQNLIINSLSTFGISVFAILSAILGIGIAYLVFRFGWNSIKSSLGTTSNFSRFVYKTNPRFGAWYDHMTYRPFKGSPRGWQIRLGRKFNIKKWNV